MCTNPRQGRWKIKNVLGRRVSAVERASQKLARNIEDTRQLYEVAKQRSSTGGLARRPVIQNFFAILDKKLIAATYSGVDIICAK